MSNKNKSCIPSFNKVQACMEQNEEYRNYVFQNSFRNLVDNPHEKYISKEDKLNFSSYDNELNFYDPKTQLNAFYKCSKTLYDECKEKL
jgi:hypothetical protein